MRIILLTLFLIAKVLAGAQDIRPGKVFRLQTVVNSRSNANIQKLNESGVSFNGDNFVEFQTYHQRVSKFNFRFNVRPRNNQNSVLLYVAQSGRIGDFVALIIKNNHYEFRFKSGIFMDIIWSKGVEVNKWTSISCGYENGVGFLKVGNLPEISQLTINLYHYMVWDTNLYIGGYDYHITMNMEVGADRGFDGCISDFEVLSQKIDMRSAINSANIQYCEETVPEVPSNQPVQEHECSGRNCKVVYVDPCSVQNPCENNGICENNGNTKICHCPIHFTGEYCQHSAPVTYSSQYTGNSYIELNKSTIVKSPAEEYISLVVSFSTMEPNGLLIWYGQPNGVAHNGQDFIALAVVGGFLEITFLFSGNERSVQIHTRVDDGMRHNAVLYRNGNSASVIFDNKRIFLETLQPTKSYLDFSGNIFIGGALNMGQFTGNRYTQGFKGCIAVYDENTPVNMSNSAVNGYNIIPCSESCLENSRHCVDGTVLTTTSATPTKVPATTKCSQVTCGTGLCRNTNLGFECFCPLNKTGDRCQYTEHLDNNNLSFNGRSFISFKLPNSFKNIQFYVRPRNNQDSILLYAAQFHYNGVGNFVALIIKDRKYEFKFRTDFELVTIYSEEEVDINKWTLISLAYENSVGFLKVGNSQKIIRHAIKRFNNIKLGKNLYIGGFDNRITLNMEVGANRGFDGCISDLDIFYQKIDMINSVKDSANVQNCAYNGPEAPVQSIPQLHSVPLVHSVPSVHSVSPVQSSPEICNPGYSGYNCDKIVDPCLAYDLCENNGICESNGNTSICDCPIHFTGEHCQHSAPITFSSQYRGTGFIELRRSAQLIAYSQNTMSLGISFSTKEPNGLLMWIGQIKGIAYNGQDFIALAVVNGLLELTFHLSGQTSFVRSDTRVDNGVFHVAILERRSNRFTLKLDYLSFNGETIYGNHNLLGNIFIGGAPEISKFTGNRYNQGFNGCIYIVKRNSEMRAANISNSIVSGYNVIPCPESCHTNLENCGNEVETTIRPSLAMLCPTGSIGTYPNCKIITIQPPVWVQGLPETGTKRPVCMPGQQGYQNCGWSVPSSHSPKCLSPKVGTYPNCYEPTTRRPTCLPGYQGLHPNCYPITTPIPMPRPQCPPGYQGIYPNCYQSTPPPMSPSTTTPLPEFAPTPSTPGACSADEWQCDNGKCINAEFKCDGLLDCIDNSDETKKNCPLESVEKCNEGEIACDNKCHPPSIRCNGAPECKNGFDEMNCPNDTSIHTS